MLTRAHDGGARRQSSFPAFARIERHDKGSQSVAANTLLAYDLIRSRRCVLMVSDKHNGASSAQASQTQRSAPRTRSRNERARGVLFESKRTRRCASSERAAMAAIKRSREPSRSGEMEDFGG